MTGNDLIIDTDVLVLGGGLAGCWAAIRASDFVPKVTIMEKAVIARSGATVFTHSMMAPVADEDLEEVLAEIVRAGEYHNDQEWVQLLLREQRLRIDDLIAWGAPFEQNADGRPVAMKGRGTVKPRKIVCNGHELMDLMRRKVDERGVQVLSRAMALNLLTSDGRHPSQGRVVGACGLDTRTGRFIVCRAKTVIIATGILENKLRTNFVNNCTGDGTALAFRSGAQLLGMEFLTHSGLTRFNDKYGFGGSGLLQGLGARFINRLGEEFMGLYDPALKNQSRVSYVCMAVAKECFEGRGPVYLDMRSFSQDKLALAIKLLPSQMQAFQSLGWDITRNPIKITPLVSFSSAHGQGGVRIDTSCRTTLEGLYAAGAATKNLVHGTYSQSGVNLAYCNVSGYCAGEYAGREATPMRAPALDENQIAALRKASQSFLNHTGKGADKVIRAFHQKILTAEVCLFKNIPRLKAAIADIKDLARVPLSAPDAHELVKIHEIKNILALSELSLEASLLRQESRDSHYREDYPFRDDENWLKWIGITSLSDGKNKIEIIPVPLETYPLQPLNRQKTPYPVQYTLKTGS